MNFEKNSELNAKALEGNALHVANLKHGAKRI
jgi:hypothetical protein